MTRSDPWAPVPTSEPASSPGAALEAHGRRALVRLGARMTLVYLVGAASGVAAGAAAGAPPWWSGLGAAAQVLLLGLVAAIAIAGTAVVDTGGLPALLRIVAVAAALGVLARVVASGPALGWPQVHALAGVVVPGVGLGLTFAAGPGWGIAAFAALGAGFALLVPTEATAAVPPTLAGAAVTLVVAVVITVAARSGFARTEAAIRAAEAADVARLQAEQRLLARRRMDRMLHDTVLSTLTLLAHAGRGVDPRQLRADCRRDLTALHSDGWSGAEKAVVPGPGRAGAGSGTGRLPRQPTPITERLDAVRDLAARRGVDLRVHVQAGVDRAEGPGPAAPAAGRLPGDRDPEEFGQAAGGGPEALDLAALEAWSSALAECVTNISRHAGVTAADVVLGGTDSALVTLIVDEGAGFEIADVRPERMGLSGSVRDRLHDVGGRARVWSQPGQGTVVELVLPWPQHVPEAEP